MNSPNKQKLSTDDVANILHLATGTVKRLIDGGTLKGYRHPDSNHRRVMRCDLEAFMREYGIPVRWLYEWENQRWLAAQQSARSV